MRIRQSAAAVAIAGAVVLGIGACSDDADDTSTSASTSQAADASAPASGSAPCGRVRRRDPASRADQRAHSRSCASRSMPSRARRMSKSRRHHHPGTVMMVQAYAKASNAAGYTPRHLRSKVWRSPETRPRPPLPSKPARADARRRQAELREDRRPVETGVPTPSRCSPRSVSSTEADPVPARPVRSVVLPESTVWG